jgi:hypothetical protein
MKNSLSILANPLSNSQMENLTKVTNETIAFDLIQVSHPIFTSADLWNIQRNLKPRNQRRYF